MHAALASPRHARTKPGHLLAPDQVVDASGGTSRAGACLRNLGSQPTRSGFSWRHRRAQLASSSSAHVAGFTANIY
jgi:hypothetical protein